MIRPVLLFVLCLLKIELREVFCGCSKHSMACFEWQECWKIMYRKNEHVVLLWYEVRHCVSMSGTKSWSSDFGGVWDPQILKCCHSVLVHYGLFSKEINGKSVNLAVWAVSVIFLFDLTLFVIDIHLIMLISLFPTPYDHFHFHPTLGLDPALILTLRRN